MSDINSTIQLKLDYEEKCSNYWIDFITEFVSTDGIPGKNSHREKSISQSNNKVEHESQKNTANPITPEKKFVSTDKISEKTHREQFISQPNNKVENQSQKNTANPTADEKAGLSETVLKKNSLSSYEFVKDCMSNRTLNNLKKYHVYRHKLMALHYGNQTPVRSVFEDKIHMIRDVDVVMEHRMPEDSTTDLIGCIVMANIPDIPEN